MRLECKRKLPQEPEEDPNTLLLKFWFPEGVSKVGKFYKNCDVEVILFEIILFQIEYFKCKSKRQGIWKHYG